MTTSFSQPTAKIYEFPLYLAQKRRQAPDVKARPVIIESACGSWYHEEAIREADDTRKN
ncbi:DUF2735 domain-containing protein [Allorhizobium undicola]|uniref:DUF2735 domain-containing protein n=1 Tax=Allorhizobium undicola TaxID=78527 RepID=UPI000A079E97|nr:DUF2735 domain-containing protein [Allorhizobium undicola]